MKHITLAAAIVAIVMFMFCMTPPVQAEELLTFKPSSVSVLKDRNGAEYVRMIMGETKELDGIKYSSGATVNAYRELVGPAKQFKAGDTVTAVVQKKDYNGTTYYTVLGFKPVTAKK